MNYFSPKSAAQRYAKGRPDFHNNTIRYIREFLQIEEKLNSALDVACGTGLSTKELLEIATHVYGTDLSQEMLNFATHTDQIIYHVAPAEKQPFADLSFDLITICSGVHWLDIDKFLIEGYRLLKSKSWLVIYDNFFLAEMVGNDAFTNWFPEVYLIKFPSPPRNNSYAWTNENLNHRNFNIVKEEEFKNSITFNKKQLILYFTTQSNIIAAVEKNETSYEDVESWLEKELTPFFENDNSNQIIIYGNWIKYIQKST